MSKKPVKTVSTTSSIYLRTKDLCELLPFDIPESAYVKVDPDKCGYPDGLWIQWVEQKLEDA